MPTNLEKYLAGEPLNEELALLKAGVLPVQSPFGPFVPQSLSPASQMPIDEIKRPLTREERAALKEMRVSAGWVVLQKMLKRATIGHTEAATLASEDDPLGKREEIAQLWLTLKVWKQMVARMNATVELEIREMELETGTKGLRDEGTADETEPAIEGAQA